MAVKVLRSLVALAVIFQVANAYSYYNRNDYQQSDNYYCKFTCPTYQYKQHVFCAHPENGVSPACGQVLQSGLTQEEKNSLLSAHNYFRQLVASGQESRGSPGPQPAASSYMPDLEWDSTLESMAQRWADQCNFAHICSTVDEYQVGQNLHKSWHSSKPDFNVEKAVQSWYDEVKLFNRNLVRSFRFNKNIGHYSQMVWSKTTKVGCGLTKYYQAREKRYYNYVVCNYGPAGNAQNQEVY